MRIILAAMLAAIVLAGSARADEFSGPSPDQSDQSAVSSRSIQAQDADPTVPGSLRSHGHP